MWAFPFEPPPPSASEISMLITPSLYTGTTRRVVPVDGRITLNQGFRLSF
jgi:hypothetical protein